MSAFPPDCVTVDGVTVRRWRVADAAGLHTMITASVEHLRPWMPWVEREPLVVADREALLSAWVDDWDAGRGFTFAITDATGVLLGSCGLHRRSDTDGLEIGYWVCAGRTGAGVATSAARALVQAASGVDGVGHVEIHHDRDNAASGRVAEKAGCTRVDERQRPPTAPGESGVEVVWRLDLGVHTG